MFAVIKTGGKQYRVVANDEFEVERLPGEAGDSLSFKEVLMVGTSIGAPFVAGASVTAEIVEQTRGPKVISFKKRRRQNSKRTRGHRQDLTLIRIGEILTDGKTASAKPEKAAAQPEDAKAADVTAENAKAEMMEAVSVAGATESQAPAKPKTSRKAKASERDIIDVSGIGPVFKARLAEHGITTLEELAALTEAEMDALDEKADLDGQPRADDWIGQAKAMLAEDAKAAKSKK